MDQARTICRLRRDLARALADRDDAEHYIAGLYRMVRRRSPAGKPPPRRRVDDILRRAARLIESALPDADPELRRDLEDYAERLQAEAEARSEAREVPLYLVLPDPS